MQIFGIGGSELILIVILALLIFGPAQIGKAGAQLRKFFLSDAYRSIKQVGNELKNLPYTIAREADPELQDWKKDAGSKRTSDSGYGSWQGGPTIQTPEKPLSKPVKEEKRGDPGSPVV